MNIKLRILIYDFGSPTVNMKGSVSFRRIEVRVNEKSQTNLTKE